MEELRPGRGGGGGADQVDEDTVTRDWAATAANTSPSVPTAQVSPRRIEEMEASSCIKVKIISNYVPIMIDLMSSDEEDTDKSVDYKHKNTDHFAKVHKLRPKIHRN